MVVRVWQMVLVDLLVNVQPDTVVNDVKIEMVAPVNHVKTMVFVLVQVVVRIYVSVPLVTMDRIANKVCSISQVFRF